MRDGTPAKMRDGIPVKCQECGYEWEYSGQYDLSDPGAKVGCWKCQTKTRLSHARQLRTESGQSEAREEPREPSTVTEEQDGSVSVPDDQTDATSPESSPDEADGAPARPYEYTATALILAELSALDRKKAESSTSGRERFWWDEVTVADAVVSDDVSSSDDFSDTLRAGLEQIRRFDIALYRRSNGGWEYKLTDDWQERRASAFDGEDEDIDRIEELEGRVAELEAERDEYEEKWREARDTNTREIVAESARSYGLTKEDRVTLIRYAVEDGREELAIRLMDGEEEDA